MAQGVLKMWESFCEQNTAWFISRLRENGMSEEEIEYLKPLCEGFKSVGKDLQRITGSED